MSLPFYTLSSFVIAFLRRSKHHLISWLQSPSAVILELKKIQSVNVFYFSPSISAIRVVSSTYLRLLIFLRAILILVCDLSSLAFHMKHSACKLNKQGYNIQPWHTPFLILNQSFVPSPVLNAASWLAYRFLKRQVKCSGIPISSRIFHSLLWSTQSKALA